MGLYNANSTNSKNFKLTLNGQNIGELTYEKWYAFSAEIQLANGKKYKLEPKGFWDSKIELLDGNDKLLEFKMGWKGIIIKTSFNNEEEDYMLTLKGLFSNKYVLFNVDKEELLVAESSFKWGKLNFDYHIETTSKFDSLDNNALLLLTIVHCINYFITMIAVMS